MGCKTIRKHIDEAERPDAFSFETSGHLASCEGCRQFADERARLREVISSGVRVQAPADFDARLRARMEERKSRPAFSWLAPAALMRMSAAAAAAVIVVFVAQYALVVKESPMDQASSSGQAAPKTTQPSDVGVQPTPPDGKQIAAAQTANPIPPAPVRMNRRASSRDADIAALDPHLVIVRGERGDKEVPIFTVSVGAQPRLYDTSSAPVARLTKASF